MTLTRERVEAATFAETLPEPISFLRRHPVPAVSHTIGHPIGHAAAHGGAGVRSAAHAKAANEDPAQRQQSAVPPPIALEE